MQEAGPERIQIKEQMFATLAAHTRDDVILASSSSSLLPSAIARGNPAADRIVIGHPFNPPELMPLVEVVPGPQTSPRTVDGWSRSYRELNKVPIRLKKEIPGFVGNRLGTTYEPWPSTSLPSACTPVCTEAASTGCPRNTSSARARRARMATPPAPCQMFSSRGRLATALARVRGGTASPTVGGGMSDRTATILEGPRAPLRTPRGAPFRTGAVRRKRLRGARLLSVAGDSMGDLICPRSPSGAPEHDIGVLT
ncbi:3-hydroxyacyl-CoA dehydrogenase NAD-binding domain-containing protein [Streptomyces sp. CB01635]|uniref:3-hydroxyacyl-CoA dehydrogenase NAD-binding domain-containing protein n=1 Tax=Streptomyces sp. CB01635 TaxID=2020326 RepID=UPI002277ECBA|nr:3-hydroxyacyl-CoA dehydrogenase NAD-binding domain-containing protein [Streptomyces sp. CB01635]